MAFEERRDTVSSASMDDDMYATSDDDRDANYDPKDDENYADEKDDIESKDRDANYDPKDDENYDDEKDDIEAKDRDANYDPKDDENYDDEKDDIEPKDDKVQEVENEYEFLQYSKFTRNALIYSLIREKKKLGNAIRRVKAAQSQQRTMRRKLELQNRILNDLMECYSLKPSDIAILKQQILKSQHEKREEENKS